MIPSTASSQFSRLTPPWGKRTSETPYPWVRVSQCQSHQMPHPLGHSSYPKPLLIPTKASLSPSRGGWGLPLTDALQVNQHKMRVLPSSQLTKCSDLLSSVLWKANTLQPHTVSACDPNLETEWWHISQTVPSCRWCVLWLPKGRHPSRRSRRHT